MAIELAMIEENISLQERFHALVLQLRGVHWAGAWPDLVLAAPFLSSAQSPVILLGELDSNDTFAQRFFSKKQFRVILLSEDPVPLEVTRKRLIFKFSGILPPNATAGQVAAVLGLPPRAVRPHSHLSAQPISNPGPVLDLNHPLRGLSEREAEIMASLRERLSDKEIAAKLRITAGTVHCHLQHIYKKLSVGNRRAAVRRYFETAAEFGYSP